MGGIPRRQCRRGLRETPKAAFVMVMNGDQAKGVILPPDGLAAHMPAGGVVLLTATIRPREARQIGATLAGSGIDLIDTPVSGGFPGAQGGNADHDGLRPAVLACDQGERTGRRRALRADALRKGRPALQDDQRCGPW